VVLYHVLEHVPAPVTTLREVHRILAPGGMVVVEVPSYAAIGFRVLGTRNLCVDYPHHLYFFTPSTLERCLESSGFAVEGRSHFSIEYSPITTLQNLLNLLPGRPNRFLDALRKGKAAGRLRREPMTWVHFAAALVLGPFALLASLAGLVAPVGNTYRVSARKS
jgi:SAM-dependent methyltransferase